MLMDTGGHLHKLNLSKINMEGSGCFLSARLGKQPRATERRSPSQEIVLPLDIPSRLEVLTRDRRVLITAFFIYFFGGDEHHVLFMGLNDHKHY